jgi:Tfp pilus assembly protein PilF/predicted porin
MLFAPGEEPKEDEGDPRFLAYRASQLLAVGRSDDAGADIQKALSMDPKYSDAHALQAIIFVVQNEREKALDSAKTAVETGPTSATAHIALSYAQQASFDLEGARASVEKAVNLDAFDALAWARLAELWSSFGYLDKSLDAAKKAVEINPDLSRTQMVLGFAYLTQVKTAESRAAFEKAIELDDGDPLSRLGLGLAKIRDGDLDAGGREIEIAASLDPNNSIVRSYLGKTYFENKQIGLDEREYAIAKDLDPNDPTPWFYGAIAKQTTNRPVEALHDLQKATELNDNRAVYRSRLMLDSDEAARSASLGRIYSDLGFQQRALVEGWSAVNTDPTNHSAHRFLADSYSILPRHEIARVSELLQSQLLQPINITPIQPRLAESNLFLISAQGPGDLSFNEFNPLFNRNRIAVQGSGTAGENDTYGGEGVVSGIYNKLSMSAGYTHFETDGWRDNADQDDDILNVFAQYEFTYKTSVMGEFKYRDTEKGDLLTRFFEDEFLPNIKEEDEVTSARLGLRHSFSPDSTLIGYFQYAEADRSLDDQFFGEDAIGPFRIDFGFETDDEDAIGGELSHLLRSRYFDLITGAGYVKIEFTDTFYENQFDLLFDPPFQFFALEEDVKTDIDHYNLYGYSYIKPFKNLILTVGASGDFYDEKSRNSVDQELDENQFNPKFGITWHPLDGTTVRGAAFRTLNRTLISQQTLEPTQVAGFNQFFDDPDTTDAWNYGVALDQKFSPSIYAGAAFTYRDLEVPWFDFTTGFPVIRKADWEEYLGRAYLYWTPHDWLALRAEYQYEKFDRDTEFNFNLKEVETHSFPLGLNFFHPSGLSAGLQATYYDQDAKINRIDDPRGVFSSGDENFWLVDAAIRYRLPKRYGFIAVGATNLFDEDFQYAETDLNNARIQPDRVFFVKATIALP